MLKYHMYKVLHNMTLYAINNNDKIHVYLSITQIKK